MSKAEREKLIEEKNQILGKKKDSHAQQILLKRKSFFNTNSFDDDKNVKGINESSLTETERSLLKVTNLIMKYLSSSLSFVGKVFGNCRRKSSKKAKKIYGQKVSF